MYKSGSVSVVMIQEAFPRFPAISRGQKNPLIWMEGRLESPVKLSFASERHLLNSYKMK